MSPRKSGFAVPSLNLAKNTSLDSGYVGDESDLDERSSIEIKPALPKLMNLHLLQKSECARTGRTCPTPVHKRRPVRQFAIEQRARIPSLRSSVGGSLSWSRHSKGSSLSCSR